MKERAVDVVVVGLGPGGEDAAGKLAEAGLSVVGIEKELVGGECPYWGCIPSKMMIRAANAIAEANRVPALGGEVTVSPDFSTVADRIRSEATDDWNDQVAVDRFTGKGGIFVRGAARLLSRDRVLVGEDVYVAGRAVVIAAGTSAAIPPIPGLAETPYWTNREAIATREVPGSLLVLGGGAIGVELGQSFARFGSTVTIMEAADRILPLEEPEASEIVTAALAAEGITVATGTAVSKVDHDGAVFAVTVGETVMTAERLLVATGRRPALAALNVDALDIGLGSGGWIPVDEYQRVAPGVWAVGDITGKGAFTHVAMYQAQIAVRDILGHDGPPADYSALPRVTFTDPEVGSVGLTEQQARAAGVDVATGSTLVPHTARGWIHQTGNEGVIKVVADRDTGTLIGATSVGPTGGEVLSGLAVAVHAQVPVATLRHMIYAYPTFHRGIEDALRDLAM
ncbi:MAG: NAD(P)/FAD-dependent oxidoreductase [Candidatus Nanopelagicales bacterium]|nr:NAD(P)/FAD-dependent oxidoreductase [Candidatus Nanopelagicales bacterium]